jgi:hypothetical protein
LQLTHKKAPSSLGDSAVMMSRYHFCLAIVLFASASAFEQQSTFLPKTIQGLMEQLITEQTASSSLIWQEDLQKMKSNILPLFTVLPKQQNNNLGAEAVRYLAYRYLLATHGLRMNGLQPCAHCVNASAPVWESVGVFKQKLPSNTQQALSAWRSKAIGLRDVAAIVLALEHLAFQEGFLSKSFIQRAYKLNGLDPKSSIPPHKLAEVVFTHFAMVLLDGSSWIYTSKRGQKIWHRMQKAADVSLVQHQQDRKVVSDMFPDTWTSLRTLRRKVVAAFKKERDFASPGLRDFSFDDVNLVIARVAAKFGSAQNEECASIKSALYSKDPSHSGSVAANRFIMVWLVTGTSQKRQSTCALLA